MLNRSRIKIVNGKINVYPWARSYKILQEEKNVMLFAVTRSKERENMFKCVGPIGPRTISLWKLARRNDIVVTSLEDAKKYIVGDVLGYSTVTLMEELGFNLDLCDSEETNFKKLLLNRFHLLPALELSAAYQMKKAGKSFNDLEKVITLDDKYKYYIALNIHTPDKIISKLQAALDTMKSDGTFDKVRQVYLK